MFAQDDWDPGRMMNGSYGDGMMNGGVWMMVVFGLLLLALVGSAILVVIRVTGSSSHSRMVTGSARDVLDRRLAQGEISAEEYGTTRTLLDP